MNAQSAKAGAFKDELDAMRVIVEVREGYRCYVCRVNPVEVIHHRKRRSQGGTNGLGNLLGLCNFCHEECHQNPRAAYEQGLLLRRDEPEVALEQGRYDG